MPASAIPTGGSGTRGRRTGAGACARADRSAVVSVPPTSRRSASRMLRPRTTPTSRASANQRTSPPSTHQNHMLLLSAERKRNLSVRSVGGDERVWQVGGREDGGARLAPVREPDAPTEDDGDHEGEREPDGDRSEHPQHADVLGSRSPHRHAGAPPAPASPRAPLRPLGS